jgi:hypothetical protein
MKPQIMWAIRAPDWSGIAPWVWDIRRTRKDSIEEFVRNGLKNRDWRYWYRAGYRAVKVRIEVLE